MELTCWWNQLWIIFMNMKSITAAAAINQFNHLFSLRMRKERLIGLICCVSGPFRNAKVNEVNFWWRKGGWASPVGFGWLEWIAFAVMGRRPIAPRKEERTPTNKTNKERVRPASPTWAAVALRSDEWSKQQSELAEQQGNCAAIVGAPQHQTLQSSTFIHQPIQSKLKKFSFVGGWMKWS